MHTDTLFVSKCLFFYSPLLTRAMRREVRAGIQQVSLRPITRPSQVGGLVPVDELVPIQTLLLRHGAAGNESGVRLDIVRTVVWVEDQGMWVSVLPNQARGVSWPYRAAEG